jgi:hypothetical protein
MKKMKEEHIIQNAGGGKAALKREFSISDTKKLYCEINNRVLDGLEVVTCNSKSNEKISHIKKEYLDFLLNRIKFKALKEYDKELKTWTIAIKELNLYGEGYTESAAVDDLIDSVIEFAVLYLDRTSLFTKTESINKQVYMLKILRSVSDRALLAKELGLELGSEDALK